MKRLKITGKIRKKIQQDIPFQMGLAFEHARLQSGLTQTQLAEKAQTSQSAIARLENGSTHHSTRFLEKVAKALDCYMDININSIENK